MATPEHKKSRPLYIANYIRAKSDADHWVSQKQILDYLYEEFGIMPDRKTIKRDIAMLRDEMGMDIEEQPYYGYRLLSREFELDDLKILVECVHAAKFISEKRTKDLIDVLCDFCSENQGKRLTREVYMCDRVKTSHDDTLRIINTIREAMYPPRNSQGFHRGKRISFQYRTHAVLDVHKEIAKHDGKRYEVSPCYLVINDGNYYLLGWEHRTQKLCTYRIDRMQHVTILEEKSVGSIYRIPNVRSYLRRTFSMYNGKQIKVEMRFENSLIDPVIDKFGVGFGTEYCPDGDDHFLVTSEVEVCDLFFAWMCGFGTKAKIIKPKTVVTEYRKHLNTILSAYE